MGPSGRTVREGKKAEQQVFASCSWNHSSLVREEDAPSSEFEALGQKQLQDYLETAAGQNGKRKGKT